MSHDAPSRLLPITTLALSAFLAASAVVLVKFPEAWQPVAPLPVYGEIPAFTLTDQHARPFTREHLRGHVFIADFFFTRCPTVCPVLTERMRQVQRESQEQGIPLRLLSFSVDPHYDTPERLSAYARAHGVDPSNWALLTGSIEAVEETVLDGFRIVMGRDADAGVEDFLSIFHGDHFVLVDARGRIRGYYAVAKDAQSLRALVRDAATLAREGP